MRVLAVWLYRASSGKIVVEPSWVDPACRRQDSSWAGTAIDSAFAIANKDESRRKAENKNALIIMLF
jgi:hypothetical protein